jgi:SAM-dependent methyltransferase
MDIYGRLAPHYDQLFPVGEAQAEFLRARLEAAGARRVLDAGCGTGRHLELLRDWGLAAVGLEPDPVMAERARQRLGSGIPVIIAGLEAAALVVSGPFGAAICLGNTLAHFHAPAALAAALAALAGLIAPEGLLITQTVNFDRVLAAGRADFPERRLDDGAGGTLVFRRDYDFAAAPARLGFRLSLRGPGLELVDTIPLLPLRRGEQEAALREAGFTPREACGDWDGSAWQQDSPATVLLAERR